MDKNSYLLPGLRPQPVPPPRKWRRCQSCDGKLVTYQGRLVCLNRCAASRKR